MHELVTSELKYLARSRDFSFTWKHPHHYSNKRD